MKTLKQGDHVSDFCEIITEEGAQATYSDFYDHRFHLSGSGHVKLFNKLSELKSGYMWIQSPVSQGEYLIQTANAVVSFSQGEFITSFDPEIGKTQLLNVRGKSEFSNSLDRMMNVSLIEGHFSYIQNEQNEGYPRRPTPIGFASYKKVTSLFKGVEPLDGRQGEEFRAVATTTVAERGVASVGFEAPVMESRVDNEGQITILRKHDTEERKQKAEVLLNSYKEKVYKLVEKTKPKKFAPDYTKKANVNFRVFGQKGQKATTVKANTIAPVAERKISSITSQPSSRDGARTPASVGDMAPTIHKDSAFESGIVDQYKKQMRHSQEVNNLIDRLKSVDMDYQKDY
ncbi:MAG: hypothetical protein Fur0010_15200 [Bdellovibrio sp.]